MKAKSRLIAYYLPQFHPIPENDIAWGEGFTEWTNVRKAKPLFKGHYQPFVPTDLGYYDLSNAEVRKAQAAMAKAYGIEGFCYWHYWFAGKRILEMPFVQVVESGEPDFPFCLCWANHSWTAIWVGDTKKIIIEQTYPGVEDYIKHFYELLPAFKDKRYIRVDGKTLFSIFSPNSLPDCKLFTDTWRNLAKHEQINDFHFVGMGIPVTDLKKLGLDASTPHTPHNLVYKLPLKWIDKITYRLLKRSFIDFKADFFQLPRIYDYATIVEIAQKQQYDSCEYPVAIPNWDHSPRSGRRALVLQNATPALFGDMLRFCIKVVSERPVSRRIVFIKAWNEWAEGNFLEPESRYGRGYLEIIKELTDN